ncbi:MAG: ABC transporter substrate-binding protein [Dehalococcoidia bacterium]|nr:MAG: ABC transporter substrate-binding protein [Dehalococcoidia bacterium]
MRCVHWTVVALVALTACAPATTASVPPPPAAPGDVRDEQQIIRAAVSGIPANLTPQVSASAFYMFWPFYDNLTQYGPNFEPRPAVAEKWELSQDGLTWTFTIRKDMKWTDGSALTAEDVAFTFDQIVNAGWPQRSFFTTVTGARAINESTVVVTTRTVDVSVPNGGPFFWVIPKRYFESVGGLNGFRDKPMGSGPYELVDFRPGDQIRFRKKSTPHAYRSPIATEIIIRAIPEPIQLINGLRTGEIDIVPFANLSAENADNLRRSGMVVNPFFVSNVSYSIPQGPNEVRQSPLRDRRVRLALNYAVNKEAIAKTVYRGFAQPVGQFAVPGSVLWDPDLPPFPYDPARAKQLLAEAGYPNGFKLPYGIDFSPMSLADTVLAVHGDLMAIGVEADLHNNENAVMQDKIFGRNNQLLGDIYAGGTGDQNGFGATVRTTNGCDRPAGAPPTNVWYCNREWERVFDQLYSERDPARRQQLGRQVTRIFREDVPAIFIVLSPLYVIHSPKIRDVRVPASIGNWSMDSVYKVK